MDDLSFNIYIPSYKRAKTCVAHLKLEYGTYVVRKSEEAEYREALKDYLDRFKIWAVEDEKICGLVEVNQFLIDEAPENLIAVLDDDIEHFFYRTIESEDIQDPAIITAELERVAQLMYDLDIGFAAVDATSRPWNYLSEFEFKGTAGSTRWVNRKCFKAKLNKDVEYNYDLDVVLQELLLNRVILKPKYLCSKGQTDTNEGGASAKKRRDQIASIELMKTKWGKYFEYDLKKNVPRIMVPR